MSASLLTVFFVSQDYAKAETIHYNPTVSVGQTLQHPVGNEIQDVYCHVLSNSIASVSTKHETISSTSPLIASFKGLQAGSTSYACHIGSPTAKDISIEGTITVK
jgi:hypothetical protein